jgi:ERF superfamily.
MQQVPKTKRQRAAAPSAGLTLEPRVDQLPATVAPQQLQQVQAPQTNPMDLIAAASARGASAEEIGKLMDLLERHQRREAEQAFARAMVQFKKLAPTIIKNAGAKFEAKGSLVEYDFATLGHICENIIVTLADCGISHNWKPEQPSTGPESHMIIMTCTLTHEMGHKDSATFKFPADPSGTKNPLQAIGSGATYGERYSLLAVCGIAVKEQGDDDGAGAAPRPTGATASRSRVKPAEVAAAKNGNQAGPSPQLLANARAEADKGRDAFEMFWKELTGAQRNMLAGELSDLEQRTKTAAGRQ